MSGSGLGRKFQFIREIASGGFGSVYLCKVIHGDGFARLAAVKLLHPKWSENEEIASRMRDEARLLGWLRHKNIVEVLDLTRIGGRVAVIMEYLEAVDVKIVLTAAKKREEWLPFQASLEVCAAVASALDAAYNRPPYAGEKPLRVIHRDIKPSNIMIDTSGTVKVLDFGVARADFAERESHTKEMSFGSIEYMPPERLFFEPDTPTSDVYSLGATLFEMLALDRFGKARLRPAQHTEYFDERWAEARRTTPFPSAEIEADIRDLLRAMLSFDPDDRPLPADLVPRFRALGRKAHDVNLTEWAEQHIPPLFTAFSNRHVERGPDSLADQTLAEDSRGFVRDESETSEVEGPPPPSPKGPKQADDDDDLDLSGKLSDEQWNKLKQQTLAEMAEPRKPAPSPLGDLKMAKTGVWEADESVPLPRAPALPPAPAPGRSASKSPAPTPKPAKPAPQPDSPRSTLDIDETWSDDGTRPVPQSAKASRPPPVDPVPPALRPPAPAPSSPGGRGGRPSVPPPAADTPMPAPVARQQAQQRPAPKRQPEPEPSPDTPPQRPARSQKPAPAPAPAPAKPDVLAAPIEPPAEEPASGGGMGMIVGVAVFLVLVLGGGAVLLVVMAGGVYVASNQTASTEAAPAPVAAAAETPAEAKPAEKKVAPATPPTGPAAKFTSLAPGTKKLQVRCTHGSGEGTTEAWVEGTDLGECTVTAIDQSRKRSTAVIKKAQPKEYACFDGDSKDCVVAKK